MSFTLRIFCILGAAIVFVMVVRKVRNARISIDDSVFWLVISFLLLLVALFPSIAYRLSELLDIRSPSNFVFLSVITILLIKEFNNTIAISSLKARVNELVEELALSSKADDDKSSKDAD